MPLPLHLPIGLLKYPESKKGVRHANTLQKESRRRCAKGSGDEIRQQELAPGTRAGIISLAFGPGHLSISALPGQSGNSIIAGHRDTHFRFLQFLALGDALQVELPDGRTHVYEVSAIDVVDSRRGSLVLDTDDSMLSLVTCYPFDAMEAGGPMRYVVSARLAS